MPGRSNLKRRSSSYDETDVIDAKRPKRNIQFNGVTVYYFPRIQGFTCIPSQGGCTLGMGPHHFYEKSFTLSEHTAEQKRIHRQKLQELNPPRSSSTPIPTTSTSNNNNNSLISGNSSMDDGSSSEESDSEEEVISDNSSSDLDVETNGFLQPVSQRQRRALLKTAGVREIASYEKNECRDIRTSREFCGCNCRDYCDPDTCFCSQSGIKCQVSRLFSSFFLYFEFRPAKSIDTQFKNQSSLIEHLFIGRPGKFSVWLHPRWMWQCGGPH